MQEIDSGIENETLLKSVPPSPILDGSMEVGCLQTDDIAMRKSRQYVSHHCDSKSAFDSNVTHPTSKSAFSLNLTQHIDKNSQPNKLGNPTSNLALSSDLPQHISKSKLSSVSTFGTQTAIGIVSAQSSESNINQEITKGTFKEMKSLEAASAEIGIGAKPKIKPKISFEDFFDSWEPEPLDHNKPVDRDYNVIGIAPKNPNDDHSVGEDDIF